MHARACRREGSGSSMPNPYQPEPIEMIDREGKPLAVIIKKRRLLVRGTVNTWRIDEEWWREEISRLYLLIEVENHKRFVVFHDLLNGGWFKQNWV